MPISDNSQALVFTQVIHGQCIIYILTGKKVLVHTHIMGWDTFELLLTQIYNEHIFNLKCSVALSMKFYILGFHQRRYLYKILKYG